MRAVDTNVLVRMIKRDDPAQAAVAEAFVKNGAWISLIVLTEAIWVLDSVYNLSAAEQSTAVEMLLQHEHLVVEDPAAAASALALFREKPVLGFSDCILFAVAKKAGHLPLGTFDRNLARVAGTQKL